MRTVLNYFLGDYEKCEKGKYESDLQTDKENVEKEIPAK